MAKDLHFYVEVIPRTKESIIHRREAEATNWDEFKAEACYRDEDEAGNMVGWRGEYWSVTEARDYCAKYGWTPRLWPVCFPKANSVD